MWVIWRTNFHQEVNGIIIRVSSRCSCIEWQAIPFNSVIGQSQQSWAHLTNTEKVLAWLGWGRYHRATATAPCPESCQVRLMTHILLTISLHFIPIQVLGDLCCLTLVDLVQSHCCRNYLPFNATTPVRDSNGYSIYFLIKLIQNPRTTDVYWQSSKARF